MTAFDIAAEQKQMERNLYRAETHALNLYTLSERPTRHELALFFTAASAQQRQFERIGRHAREAFTCFCRVGPWKD